MRLPRIVVAATVVGGWFAAYLATAPPSVGEAMAAPIVAVGWWSRQPVASAQPSGGFQVAYGLDGAESVAAVRVSVPNAGALHASLTLAESSSSVAASRAAMQVCTTTDAWSPANPGSFQQAPPSDCTHAVPLTRDGSVPQWTADVSGLLSPGSTANLMIEPVSQPVAGPVDPGYTVTIIKAEMSADGTPSPAAAPSAAPSGAVAPGSGNGQPSPAAVASPPPPVVSAGSPAPLATAASPPPASAPPATSAPPTTSAPATTIPTPKSIAAPRFSLHIAHHGKPWWRLILFVPLAALTGAGASVVRRTRAPGLTVR